MIGRNEIDYEVFVDCTPLHNYVPNDPILEAMQNQRKRLKSFEGKSSQVDEASVKQRFHAHQTPRENREKVPAVASDQLLVAQPETKAGHKGRLHDERPSWLPPDWHVEKETRLQGKKAGCLDSFFVDPMGNRFRSKKKVLSFLQTEVLPRRTANKNPNPAMTNGGGEGGRWKTPAGSSSRNLAMDEPRFCRLAPEGTLGPHTLDEIE
ncbi:hypothetical protein AAG906_032812 [Vitis piasezkii]